MKPSGAAHKQATNLYCQQMRRWETKGKYAVRDASCCDGLGALLARILQRIAKAGRRRTKQPANPSLLFDARRRRLEHGRGGHQVLDVLSQYLVQPSIVFLVTMLE